MKKLYYDFHIHSCLSPCGSDNMTPYNIVNMAKLGGLGVIAIADHNSTRNCGAAVKAGEQAGLLVLPAMELTTSEDVHVLCLFEILEAAEDFCQHVYSRLPKRKNKPEFFGPQILYDENDQIAGYDDALLSGATDIGVYDTAKLVARYGGLAIPSHIDRPSHSLLNNMGFADPAMGFNVFEISHYTNLDELNSRPDISGSGLILDSDAHDLSMMRLASQSIQVETPTAAGVLRALRSGRQLTPYIVKKSG